MSAGAVAAGVGLILYDEIDYDHSFDIRNNSLTFEAEHINSDVHFYMMDVSVQVPAGEDAILSVTQPYRWDASSHSGIQMVSPPPVNSKREYDVYIPANHADASTEDINLPVFGEKDDFDNKSTDDYLGKSSDEKDLPTPHKMVATDVLAGFDLNRRIFDKTWGNNDQTGGTNVLICSPTQSVIDTANPTSENFPLANFEWRIRRPEDSDLLRHASRDDRKGHDHNDANFDKNNHWFFDGGNGQVVPPHKIRDQAAGDGTVRFDFAKIEELKAESGFYTVELLARNEDGYIDTLEKDIAVGKDLVPILDHPEPLPADTGVRFHANVAGPPEYRESLTEAKLEVWDPDVEKIGETTWDLDGDDATWPLTSDAVTLRDGNNQADNQAELSFTYDTGDEQDTVTRHYWLPARTSGPVVLDIGFEKPAPIGETVTFEPVVANAHDAPEYRTSKVTEFRWDLYTRKSEESLQHLETRTTQPGENSAISVDMTSKPVKIVLTATFEDRDPQVTTETISPELPTLDTLLEIDGPARIEEGETVTYEPNYTDFEETEDKPFPDTVESKLRQMGVNIDERRANDDLGSIYKWTLTTEDDSDRRPTSKTLESSKTETFEFEPGEENSRYRLRLQVGGHEGVLVDNEILSTSMTVYKTGPANVRINGPAEVPPDTEVTFTGGLATRDASGISFEWEFEGSDGEAFDEPAQGDGETVVQSFPETGEYTVTLQAIENGTPLDVATRQVTVTNAAVAITGPARMPLYTERRFSASASVGAETGDGTITDLSWSMLELPASGASGNPVDAEQLVGEETQWDGDQIDLGFVDHGVYELQLVAEVDLDDGGTEERTARQLVSVRDPPVALEIGLSPPPICGMAADPKSTSTTTLEAMDVQVDGAQPDWDRWQVTTGGQVTDPDSTGSAVQVDSDEGTVRVQSHKCEPTILRYEFRDQLDAVETAFGYELVAKQKAAEPFVRALVWRDETTDDGDRAVTGGLEPFYDSRDDSGVFDFYATDSDGETTVFNAQHTGEIDLDESVPDE